MYQLLLPSTDPVPPSINKYRISDPVPSCINQYRLLLTQNHHVSISTAFYWPSTIIYQPEPLHTDPVPPSINQYQPKLLLHGDYRLLHSLPWVLYLYPPPNPNQAPGLLKCIVLVSCHHGDHCLSQCVHAPPPTTTTTTPHGLKVFWGDLNPTPIIGLVNSECKRLSFCKFDESSEGCLANVAFATFVPQLLINFVGLEICDKRALRKVSPVFLLWIISRFNMSLVPWNLTQSSTSTSCILSLYKLNRSILF